MPIRLEITNITKPDRQDHHSRILWAGHPAGMMGLNGFKDTPANIARCIMAGTHEFYVRRPGILGLGLGEVAVMAMPPLYPGGEPFIQTQADHTTRDNLLSLPEFPPGDYSLPLPVPYTQNALLKALHGY